MSREKAAIETVDSLGRREDLAIAWTVKLDAAGIRSPFRRTLGREDSSRGNRPAARETAFRIKRDMTRHKKCSSVDTWL